MRGVFIQLRKLSHRITAIVEEIVRKCGGKRSISDMLSKMFRACELSRTERLSHIFQDQPDLAC
jgi:hypothetical protein